MSLEQWQKPLDECEFYQIDSNADPTLLRALFYRSKRLRRSKLAANRKNGSPERRAFFQLKVYEKFECTPPLLSKRVMFEEALGTSAELAGAKP